MWLLTFVFKPQHAKTWLSCVLISLKMDHFIRVACKSRSAGDNKCLTLCYFLMNPLLWVIDGCSRCFACWSQCFYVFVGWDKSPFSLPCPARPTLPFDLFLHRCCLLHLFLFALNWPFELFLWMLGKFKKKKHGGLLRLWREGGGVRERSQKWRLSNHSANMSTEIKLVYYFQRGKKKNFTKQKSSHILH